MTDHSQWRRDKDVGKTDVNADVDAELEFHREALIEDLIRSGLAPEQARAEAERRLGVMPTIRAELVEIDSARSRKANRSERFSGLFADLQFAVRTLSKQRFYTAMALVSLALGIGITTTILSAAHGILVRPLPFANPSELVVIYAAVPAKGWHGTNVSFEDYRSWREQNRTLADLGIYTWSSLAFSGDQEPERVEGAAVSANLFPILGVAPQLGRTFTKEETEPNGPSAVLLSDRLWRRRFAADPGIVGRAVLVDGKSTLVVGVMPPGFGFPERGQAWRPFVQEPWDTQRGNRGYAGTIGRLKPGVSMTQAQADLDQISARLAQEFPRDNFGWTAEAITMRDDLVGDLRRPLQIFIGAVALVLLVVAANVANLALARGADRQRELAVRIAIGAGRARLVRQLITESLVLALFGGMLGTGLAVVGLRLFRLAFPNDVPFYIHLGLDGTALGIAAGVSLATGVLFGTAPAIRATALDLAQTLRDGTRAGDGRDKSRFRRTLVTLEFALSFALLVAAGLLIKSYRGLVGTDLGFREHGILSIRVSLPSAVYDTPAKIGTFYRDLLDRVGSLPGVQSVGSAQGIPFSGWNVQSDVEIEGRPPRRQGEELTVHFQSITPGYFPTIGVDLVRGRMLTAADRDTANLPILINETLVKQEFAGVDPIGQRIKLGGIDSKEPWFTVVGVVKDFRHYRLPQPMGPAMYLPYFAQPSGSQTLAIRTDLGDPHTLAPAILGQIHALDPSVPGYQVQTFEEVVSRSVWRQRLQGQTLGIFAGLALVLASIGIYGVISYSVAQRTRELGVRIALGATKRQVLGLVIRQGIRLVGIGTVVGAAIALGSGRLLGGLLYGVEPTDPAVFLVVFVGLAGSALVACYFPARRAATIDPLVAMRSE